MFAFVLTTVEIYAQTGLTGINTFTPQQQLQVSGTTSSTQIGTSGIFVVKPTIRIEGLNNTNNSVASSSTSLAQPVDVTQNGDIILSPNLAISLITSSLGTDAITSAVTVSPADGTVTSATLKTYTFTLNQTAMVHFLASVSTSVFNTSGSRLGDSNNKICFSSFRFTAVPPGSGIAINTSFGSDSFNYINTSILAGATGNFYLQPESYLVLPPGTYTLILLGQAYGESYDFNAVFGQAADDMISIVAIPL